MINNDLSGRVSEGKPKIPLETRVNWYMHIGILEVHRHNLPTFVKTLQV